LNFKIHFSNFRKTPLIAMHSNKSNKNQAPWAKKEELLQKIKVNDSSEE